MTIKELYIALIVLTAVCLLLVVCLLAAVRKVHHVGELLDMETEAARQNAANAEAEDMELSAQVYWAIEGIANRIKANIL